MLSAWLELEKKKTKKLCLFKRIKPAPHQDEEWRVALVTTLQRLTASWYFNSNTQPYHPGEQKTFHFWSYVWANCFFLALHVSLVFDSSCWPTTLTFSKVYWISIFSERAQRSCFLCALSLANVMGILSALLCYLRMNSVSALTEDLSIQPIWNRMMYWDTEATAEFWAVLCLSPHHSVLSYFLLSLPVSTPTLASSH